MAQRVADRGERRVHDDDALMRVVQQFPVQHARRAGQVDQHHVVAAAHHLDQALGGAVLDARQAVEVLLGGHDVQPLPEALGDALHQELVHAIGSLKRLAEAAAHLAAEQQGDRAGVQVGIEQQGVVPLFLGEQEGEVGGDGRGADAAAHADDRHHATAAHQAIRAAPSRDERQEVPLHQIAVERLRKVFEHPEPAREAAIEREVGALADNQHAGAGLDELGEVVEVRDRVGRS